MSNLSTVTKNRMMTNLKTIKQGPGYQFIRQLCTAEAGEPNPDYDGLKSYLMEVFEAAIDEEIRNGIERQKGRTAPVYPGATR